jgi:hypothetical protein
MSEYQYYEFLALDQPLTERQMLEVRSFSTRARITPTSFVNEYNWGNFKGDIDHFMTKHYDAFVYIANWGTHDLRFRLPKAGVDVTLAKQYCVSHEAHLRLAGNYAVLSLSSQDESGDWEEGEGLMSSLAPLRADLLAGDYRCLYLGWLNCVGCHELDDDEIEPPVPPGLAELTAPLRALAGFLRIDDSLIESAAEASPPLSAEGDSAEALRAWIESLPVQEKDALLFRLTQEPPAAVQREILRRFRQVSQPRRQDTSSARRTVGQLLVAAEQRTQEKRRRAAEKKAREEARRAQEAARARQKHLDVLAKREPQTWQQADALIATRQSKKYDEAVQLLCDLRDLSEREGKAAQTASRLSALRAAHSSKPSLIRRMDDAKL